MKRIRILLAVAILLAIVSGCRHTPEHVPDKGGMTTLELARQMSDEHANRDSVLAVYDKAIREYREGKADYNPVGLYSDAGQYYFRSGDNATGAEYMRIAADSLVTNPPKTVEERTDAAKLLGNLGNVYRDLGMLEDALEFNARAIDMSAGLDAAIPCNLWRMRAVLHQQCNPANVDSVMHCFDLAINYAGTDTAKMTRALGMRLDFMTGYPETFDKQRISNELKAIEKLPWRDERNLTSMLSAMGHAYCAIGENSKGIPLLEEALAIVRERDDILMMRWAEKALCHFYAESGRGDKLAEIYPELETLNDTILNREKLSTVVGAEFKYRTKEKEKEAQMLRQQEQDNRKLIVMQWAIIGLAVILLCELVLFLLKRNRKNREEKAHMESEMSELISRQVQFNSTIENLNRVIEELNAEISKRECGEEIKVVLNDLKPSMLSGKEETAFRRSFAKLYPHFLRELHAEFPSLTASDELLCMLIFLEQGNDDIAYSLGISRQSVNTARYRLRRRLNLDKETDLNAFIAARRK